MDDREMKEFLAGTQSGLETGIATMEDQARSTRVLRDEVAKHIEELATIDTLEDLKKALVRQAIVRRDALNDVVVQFEAQVERLKGMLKTSQEASKG
jgi:hypothetical protein